MISFKQFLSEGRDAPLYHGTDIQSLKQIISNDVLKANKENHNGFVAKREGDGRPFIALSRDIKHSIWFAGNGNDKIAVIKLDQRKLAQRYRIEPIHTWKPEKSRTPMYRDRYSHIKVSGRIGYNEFEERVYSNISPLDKYVSEYLVNEEAINWMKNEALDDPQWNYIVKHPKLKTHKLVKGGW